MAKTTLESARFVARRCGINTVKKLASGFSFYATQKCLFQSKSAAAMADVLVQNLKAQGWIVEKVTHGVKPDPSFAKWSIEWVRITASPPIAGYKPACGICGVVHNLKRRCPV